MTLSERDYPYYYEYFIKLKMADIGLNKLRRIQNSIYEWVRSTYIDDDNDPPSVVWMDRAGYLYANPTNMVPIVKVLFRDKEDMLLFILRWQGSISQSFIKQYNK